jgi:hypothetical protein
VSLLRYRFGTEANIGLHFHEVEDRTFFFYPVELTDRDRPWVFVEFQVGSQVPCIARGRLHRDRAGRFVGSWIEFPAPELPQAVQRLARTRRARERIPVDLIAMITWREKRFLCGVSDVSASGIRLSGLPCSLNVGDDLSVELVGMPRGQVSVGKARVAWLRLRNAGLDLQHKGAAAALANIVEQAAAANATALDHTHVDSCACRHGARPAEPPLPIRRGRR